MPTKSKAPSATPRQKTEGPLPTKSKAAVPQPKAASPHAAVPKAAVPENTVTDKEHKSSNDTDAEHIESEPPSFWFDNRTVIIDVDE